MKRVIVPIDFGPSSVTALLRAAQLTRLYDATLIVVHVLPVTQSAFVYGELVPLPPMLAANLEQRQTERTRDRIHALLNNFALGDIRTAVKLPRGDVFYELSALAKTDDVFMVVGSNTRHLIQPGFGERLAWEAKCPVLICQERDLSVPLEPYQNAVVAVDGTESSERLAAIMAQLVGPNGRLELLHVVPNELDQQNTEATENGSTEVPVRARAIQNFESWVANLEIPVRTSGFVASIPPAQAILSRVIEAPIDLIGCGSHLPEVEGKLGAAEVLARHSPTDLLILPLVQEKG